MNDQKKISKNYVVANGPVNRRTTAKTSEPQGQEDRIVKVRQRIAQARHRLGSPLTQRLAASQNSARPRKQLSASAIAMTIGATASATGVLLGLIQNSVLITACAAIILSGLGVWAYLSAKARPQDGKTASSGTLPLVDESDLARLDAVLATLVAEADQATVDQLASLKETLMRCITLITSTHTEASLSEDHLYVREAIRRYIPDSITSYLQIPEKDRMSLVLDSGKSALDLLHDQFGMIQGQLGKTELALSQLAGDDLMRQHRFLAAKTRN